MNKPLIFTCLALLMIGPVAAQVDPATLLAQADARRFIPDMTFVLTLTAFQEGKVVEESTLWGWVKTPVGGGSKALLAFAEPAAQRGRKMLMDGPTVYLLFPKTRNPIRLSPLQVLVGQSSNGDVARTGFSEDYLVSSLETEDHSGVPCWVFTLTAKPDRQGTAYRRVTLWVEKEGLKLVAADFYGTGGQKLKHAEYSDYRSVADKMVPFRLDITDGADESRHTVLQYTKVGRQALPAGAFRRDYLETWAPEAPK